MGENNAVLVQILAVVAILFFCFVTYMNTKTWRWLHVTFMFLVFAAALTFVVYASMVMKMRQAWQKTVADLEVRVTAEEKKLEQAIFGDLNSQADRQKGLVEIREELNRAIIDRGRVWRHCSLVDEPQITSPGAPVSEVKLKLSTVPKNAIEGQKVKPNGMTEKTILYAFKKMSDDNAPLAYAYVGEFYAAAVADDSISLTSTLPLSPQEQALLVGPQDWILHEAMPRDSNAAMKALNPAQEWKEILDPNAFHDPQVYAAILAEYERDGKDATDEDSLKAENLEKIYAEVKFKQPYELKVDATDAVSPAGDGSESRLFNTEGEALSPILRRGDVVKFKQGDTAEIIFNGYKDAAGNVQQKGAAELADEGVVEIVRKVYRRKLNDYAYEFREIWMKRVKIQQLSRALDYEIDQVDKEFAVSQANLQSLNDRIAKLEADQQKVVDEKGKITGYVARVKASLDKAKAEFTSVMNDIDRKHAALVAASQRALSAGEKTDNRTASAR
jgi:hypothetical protein